VIMLIIDYFTMMMIMMTIIANLKKKRIHGWVGLGKITTTLAMIACVVSILINCNVILLTTQSSPIN